MAARPSPSWQRAYEKREKRETTWQDDKGTTKTLTQTFVVFDVKVLIWGLLKIEV